MGTSNFHSTGCLYTVTEDDEFIWDNTRENVMHELADDKCWISISDLKLETELRSFPATSIGLFQDYIFIGQEEVMISVVAMTRSGYYEGFNLDYEVAINQNYSDYEDGKEVLDDMYEYIPSMRGLITMNRAKWTNDIDEAVKAFTDRLEHVFSMYADGMKVVATFSNGETIYERIEDESSK